MRQFRYKAGVQVRMLGITHHPWPLHCWVSLLRLVFATRIEDEAECMGKAAGLAFNHFTDKNGSGPGTVLSAFAVSHAKELVGRA